MICKNCGSPLQDNAKFCGSCGAMVEVAQPQPTPVSYVAPVQPKADGAFVKKAPTTPMKLPKIVLPIIAGAAVVILILVLLVSGVFSGSKATVGKAFTAAISEYADVAAEMNLSDVAAISKSCKNNQELKLWIEDGGDELDGLGIRLNFSYNQSGKEGAIIATPYYESADLLTAQVKFDDSKIYVGSPELLKKDFVMIDTMTIGQDLANKNAPGMEDVSFNMFEMIEQMQKAGEITKDQQKALAKAGAAFAKAIEVKKDGKNDIKVNGNKLKCTIYNVVIPQDAMEAFLDALETIFDDMNPNAMLDILEEAGFPVDDMDMEAAEIDTAEVFDVMSDVVDELGDIEAELGIHKGYVVSIKSELEIEGIAYTMNIQLGGGKNYVDDIYIEMLDEDEYGFIITSTGNHAMKKGVFTDETVVSKVYYGDEREMISWEMNWEPKGKDGNFEWTLENYGDEFTFEGTLHTTKDSLSITLDELEIDGMTVGLSYTLGDYKAPSIKVGTTLAFADMDEGDMEDLAELIEENGEAWVEMMEDDYEDVLDYLYYMF
jgi:hypothetical protein